MGEKSAQRCPTYLRWKQCTSCVTTVTILPRARARSARVTRSGGGKDDLSRCKNLPRALSSQPHLLSPSGSEVAFTPPVTVNHQLSFPLDPPAAAGSAGLPRGHRRLQRRALSGRSGRGCGAPGKPAAAAAAEDDAEPQPRGWRSAFQELHLQLRPEPTLPPAQPMPTKPAGSAKSRPETEHARPPLP